MVALPKIILRRAPVFLALLFSQFVFLASAQENQGMLEICLKDHRDAIGDFAHLQVTIEAILLSRKPGLRFWRSEWHELKPTADSADLTQYTHGKTARVFRAPITAAAFGGFHVKIKKIEGLLKKNQRAVPVKNTLGPVALTIEVRPRQETVLIIDLVVTDFSDHPPRGYELGLNGYELYLHNKRVVKIPPG